MNWNQDELNEEFAQHEEYINKLARSTCPERFMSKFHGGFCRMLCRKIVQLRTRICQLEQQDRGTNGR